MKALDLTVSLSPHGHGGSKVTTIYYNMFFALLPAVAVGVVHYGFDALRVVATSVASAMLTEALIQRLLKKPVTIANGSAAVSGLLLALILPASVPYYAVIMANVIGIAVVKELFGGLGANPLNPVLVGWAILRATGTWAGFLDFNLGLIQYDPGFIIQDPLSVLKANGPAGAHQFSLLDLFLGRQAGGIGASAIVWVLVAGLYLVLRGFIRWQIPLWFLVGVVLGSGLFWFVNPEAYVHPLFHLVTGNVMIGAFFFATENGSTAVNRWGMICFGLGCGLLTVLLRVWSIYTDGVVYACLLMNLFVPLLDKIKAKQVEPMMTPIRILEEGVEDNRMAS